METNRKKSENEHIDSYIKTNKTLYFFIKRLFDLVLALLLTIFLSPVFLTIAIMIKKDSTGSVFYKHRRVGKNGKELYVYKFRTMIESNITFQEFYDSLSLEQKNEWNENFKLENDPRITKLGKFLRESSLDELPQLLNIIQGNMSFIGPRPVVKKELEYYKGNLKEQLLSVTPGLTGYWACSGRSNIGYPERCELELYYVENCSFKLDFIIFWETLMSVIKKEGAK